MSRTTRNVLAVIVLTLALLPLCGGALLGRLPFDADNTLFTIPFFSLFQERPFPLWNPYQFCGMPLIGNLQYQMFYPPRVLFLWFDSTTVYGLYCFLHWFVAATGMYAALRFLRMSWTAAVAGALSFACGSFMQGRVSNPVLFASAAWFPAVLAAAMCLTRSHHRWRKASVLALVIATLSLAGSPHGVFYAIIMVGLWYAWSISVAPLRLRAHAGMVALFLGIAAVLAAMLWCPTWWHALELLPRTVRSTASFDEVVRDPLLPRELPLLWLGGMYTPEYLDKTSYCGVLMLTSVFMGFVVAIRHGSLTAFLRGPVGLGLILCATGILFALGTRGGLYYLLYAVPGFRFLIGPTRALVLFNLGWSLTGAAALDFVMQRPRPRLFLVCGAAGILSIILLITLFVRDSAGLLTNLGKPRYAHPDLFMWSSLCLWLVPLCVVIGTGAKRGWGGACVVLMLVFHAANLVHYGQRVVTHFERPTYFADPPTVRYLRRMVHDEPWRVLAWDPSRLYVMDAYNARGPVHLMPKLPDYYRIREVQGYDPMMLRDYVDFMTALAGRNPIDDPWRTATVADPTSLFTDLAGARYIIGNPWERTVSRSPRQQDVELSGTIRSLALTSMAVEAHRQSAGKPLAKVLLENSHGGMRSYTLHAGRETADVRAVNSRMDCSHPPIQPNQQWYALERKLKRSEGVFANYFARIEVAPDEYVKLRWGPSMPGYEFLVPLIAAEGLPPAGEESRFEKVFTLASTAIYRNHTALPRQYLASRIMHVDGVVSSAELLRQHASEIGRIAILPNNASVRVDAQSTGSIKALHWDSNGVNLDVRSTGRSFVVFTESWYPGWRAWVNDSEVPVVQANGIYMGVEVPPGRATVRFRYAPLSLTVCVIISLGACVVVVLPIIPSIAFSRKRRARKMLKDCELRI